MNRKAAHVARPLAPLRSTHLRVIGGRANTTGYLGPSPGRAAMGFLMAVGEIYVKLIVGFPRDPKVRALVRFGTDAGLARDLYVQMVLYCKENLTDGWVPAEEIGVLVYPLPPDHGNQLAKQLASVGLIKEASNGEADGWQVLAYVKRNGTKRDVERLSKVRAEAGRKGGRPAGQSHIKANGNQVGKQNKSRPNPYTETETETDSGSVGDELPVEGGFRGDDAAQAPPKQKRGTRIPDDFHVTPEMVAWARERCPHVDGRTETEKFVNYWRAKSGREAAKLDWVATWRNWMLTAEQQASRAAPESAPGASPVSHLDEWKHNRA